MQLFEQELHPCSKEYIPQTCCCSYCRSYCCFIRTSHGSIPEVVTGMQALGSVAFAYSFSFILLEITVSRCLPPALKSITAYVLCTALP